MQIKTRKIDPFKYEKFCKLIYILKYNKELEKYKIKDCPLEGVGIDD